MKGVGAILDSLRRIVGAENVLTDSSALETFSHDATFVSRIPEFVIRPGSTEEVSSVVKLLYGAEIPITTRGAGTGLSGGAVPIEGGAVIALDALTKIEIDAPSMCAVAGAGAITARLQEAAVAQGLMYPPDPASIDTCTIGGNIATNAGGPACLKYGVTGEYVIGLTVVLADGRVLLLGGKARKRSAGYRLAQLFVGSEGTLGIVTEAVLRLVPLPKERATALVAFRTVGDAAEAVAALLAGGHLPAALELIDRSSLEYVADLLPEGFPHEAAAVLLVEQDGSDRHSVTQEILEMVKVAEASSALGSTTDLDGSHRSDMWRARRMIGTRLLERRSYRLSEDIAVPIARIPEMVEQIREISESMGVSVAVFGHAGDGNLHPSLIFDDREPETLRRVEQAAARIFRAALELGGTVSAEHGLGAVKRDFAEEELGTEALEIMRSFKYLLDPKGLLNPGKVFPARSAPDASFLASLPGWLAD